MFREVLNFLFLKVKFEKDSGGIRIMVIFCVGVFHPPFKLLIFHARFSP
jgi:hypothetical protein